MNPLAAKFGKAFKTIQKDGIFRGGKRVTHAMAALFRRVSAGDILIITGGVGDSARYRADHQAEELAMNGFRVSTTVQDNPFLSGYHRKFDIFIFHRVIYTPAVKRIIESAKTRHKTIIFDTDDLVFDKKYLTYMDYFKKMNFFERQLYINGVGSEILNDPYVTACTVTTSFLAEKLRHKGKTVFIIHNRLSRKDLRWVEEILKKKQKPNHNSITLGYFSGSMSHNKDFATIAEALATMLRRHDHVRLLVAGPLEIDKTLLSEFKDRITKSPYVDRRKYFSLLSTIDINLAPLETGNPFCEAKSELKFFEPGIMAIPTVAVRNRTFGHAILDGINGFLAEGIKEWIEKIEALILNQNLKMEMGRLARKTSLENYTTINASNHDYYRFLKNKLTAQPKK